MKIFQLFPVTIAMVDNPNHNLIKKNIVKECSLLKKQLKKVENFGEVTFIIHWILIIK